MSDKSTEYVDQVESDSDKLFNEMVALMEYNPDSTEAQNGIKKVHEWVSKFIPCDKKGFLGMSDVYATEDFKKTLNAKNEGFSDWLIEGIKVYCQE